jgi:hypothetical protein
MSIKQDAPVQDTELEELLAYREAETIALGECQAAPVPAGIFASVSTGAIRTISQRAKDLIIAY